MSYAERMINVNEFPNQWEDHPDETEERKKIEDEYEAIRSGVLPKDQYVESRLKRRNEARFARDHDPLMGILNRRGFVNQFVQVTGSQIRRVEADNATFEGSLLLADLDLFKIVNDTYGHETGDLVLIAFAEIAKGNLGRFGDTLGRYGGEELIIYLPDISAESAVHIAEKIRTDVRTGFENSFINTEWPKTVSIGIQGISQLPKDEIVRNLRTTEGKFSLLKHLSKHADIALYNAKSHGRNQTTVFKEGMIIPKPQPTAAR